ncbi:MAG: 3-isopropylmalate dehydrogenase [Gammaproteobacteria bacterium]|nr:3-isopropylmalate dehydrogenase [Gammaproteobacteria bacterium]
MSAKLLILSGDGIGPEIITEAEKVLSVLRSEYGLNPEIEHALVGGAALDALGVPLPEETLNLARACDAILFGAIGGPKWETVARALRPERGLLELRSALGLFANLRPVRVFPELAGASTLKAEIVAGLDIMIIRELTGGIYFGEPRGIRDEAGGRRTGFNTMCYSDWEIERIADVAFKAAMQRSHRVCSVDKANVLETSELWREVVTAVGARYPEVELQHMYVDNAAMQLVRSPGRFDVMLTENLFGDILSDLASMLSGSIGMLASASMDSGDKGLYEPIHGSAPDIAGRQLANPLAAILSLSMLLRHSLREADLAERVACAVRSALQTGVRTADICSGATRCVSTAAMGDAVTAALRAAAG